jgi:uncharacterized protein YxeA
MEVFIMKKILITLMIVSLIFSFGSVAFADNNGGSEKYAFKQDDATIKAFADNNGGSGKSEFKQDDAALKVFAANTEGPEIYNITVDSKGGSFDFNKIEVRFEKGFLGKNQAPIDFVVSIYAENGTPYIEFNPSVKKFVKDVVIIIREGDRTFYDTVTGKNITIHLNSMRFKVEHFSRYVTTN